MYLYPVQIIFWMDKHFTSNAEMSRLKQFHVSRPKRNVFLIMMLMPLFFKPSLHYALTCIIKQFNDTSH